MQQKHAFTLVELSIVLVILGLLIGGVLTGQSLIRAAELRSVTTQQQRYITAVQTFRDKYFALPGDMTNATAYWGIVSGSTTGFDAACQTAASTGPATCNGNGDGLIANNTSGGNEYFRFWQHLANAGLIEGSYDGITHGSAIFSATTANAPSGRISSSLWHSTSLATQSGVSGTFDGQYNNILEFGAIYANGDPVNPILKAEEAYNIDTKVDDGRPASGRLVTRQIAGWTGTTCTDATASSQLTANYALNNSAIACALLFRQAF